MRSRRALTEVSSTSSPTTTRTPPIRAGLQLHMGVELAAEAPFQRSLEVGELGVADLVGAEDLRIGHTGGGVGQHVVLGDDLGHAALIFSQLEITAAAPTTLALPNT